MRVPSLGEQLQFMTVKIVTHGLQGQGSGTGFFVNFSAEEAGKSMPLLITNKHVIDNAETGTIRFNIRGGDKGVPLPDRFFDLTIGGIRNSFVYHPDANVDLAALPLASIIKHLEDLGNPPFILSAGEDYIATKADLADADVCTDIVMIGYPNGLWDQTNNKPILRRGITATSPSVPFDGKPHFLIDCACFPGSSGSPVFMYNPTGYTDRAGAHHLGTPRIKLIGVLFAGPQVTVSGQIVVLPTPTAMNFSVNSQVMMNLGFCVE